MGLNNAQIAEIIDLEGIGYSVEDYTSPENIEDLTLRMYWQTAKDALTAIREHLKEYLPE